MRRVVLGVSLAAALCGCKSLEQGARDEFSRDYTCPDDAITSVERDDLDADELTWGPPPAPPAEIASDPVRLALWKKQHASSPSGHVVFSAEGCKHKAIYTCGRSKKGHPMCTRATYAPLSGPAPAATAWHVPWETSDAGAARYSVVKAHFEPFRRCYQDALARDPALHGRVTLRVNLDKGGHVFRSVPEHAPTDLTDPALAACVASAFSQLSFPVSQLSFPDAGPDEWIWPIIYNPGD